MAFYFIGGEDHDFTVVGTCTVDTATTAARRTANARCSLKVAGTTGTDGWQTDLPSAVSSLWVTGRVYIAMTGNSGSLGYLISLFDGTTRRLVITNSGGSSLTTTWRISKFSAAGVLTTLATASTIVSKNVIQKLDLNVTYGTSGNVKLYLDGTLIIDYTGDITTDGATTLNKVQFGHFYASLTGETYWSEMIVASEDTRAMNVVTLPPSANGNTFNFDTGSYADVDEVTLSDADLITSGTSGQLAQFTIGSSGITGTPAVRAVCVSARAQKGASGPQNAKMNVRTAGADHLSSTIALPAAMNRIANIFANNPATSGPWAYTDITAAGFNVGVQSET